VTAAAIVDRACILGLRIATAESCTGGMVAAALTDIAGASDVFERGFVT
jgi:nicotinamide-nucleotide amidase